jgi:hypothetical protein
MKQKNNLKKTMKFFLSQPEIGITLHKRKVKKKSVETNLKTKILKDKTEN